jgi:DNA-binding NarL/FixJ family response regulator
MEFTATVADPHDITRCGTKHLIRDLGGRVIPGGDDCADWLRLLSTHEPDLLVTETSLTGMSGLELLRRAQTEGLLGTAGPTDALVLTTEQGDRWVREAFRLGAAGYVLKSDPLEDIEAAVRAILRGRPCLSEALPAELADASVPEGADLLDRLTEEERQVLWLTARGLTDQDIGATLSMGQRAVEEHRRAIRSKLRLNDRVEMVRYAARQGLHDGEGAAMDGAPRSPRRDDPAEQER